MTNQISELMAHFGSLAGIAHMASDAVWRNPRAVKEWKPGYLLVALSASTDGCRAFIDFAEIVDSCRDDETASQFLSRYAALHVDCAEALKNGKTDPALAFSVHLKRNIDRFLRMAPQPDYWGAVKAFTEEYLAFARKIEQTILSRPLGF